MSTSTSTRRYMSKRQRACDFCRSRKTACRIEGHLPCRLCALHGKQCTFVEAALPRKRPTAGSEAGATRLTVNEDGPVTSQLAHHFVPAPPAGTSPQDYDLSDSASHAAFQHEDLTETTRAQNLLFQSLADQFFNEFGEGADEAQYDQTFPALGSGLSPEGFLNRSDVGDSPNWLDSRPKDTQLDSNDDLNAQALGHSGDMDPYLLQNYRYDSLGAFKFKQLTIRSVCHGSLPTQFLLSQPGMFSLSRQEMGLRQIPPGFMKEELETLVPADTGTRLIALFSRFILPQYPIFSESQFPDPQSSPPDLLAAIYMIAQPFAKLDDVLSIELAYESLNNQALFKLVNEALQYAAHNPSLATVQTMLLLVLRPSTNPLILESSFKWSLHGQLVTTAQTLGLHYDPGIWNIPSWQIALRRRISSTIFALDKWLASSLGRPPLVTKDAWLVTSLTTGDGYTSALSPEIWSEHMRYAELGSLLGDVLLQLYSLRAVSETASNSHSTLSISKTLLERLSNWHQGCPQQSPDQSGEAAALPTICNLGFHYVQMTIFRAIMRSFVGPGANEEAAEVADHLHGSQKEVTGFARTGVRSSTIAAANFVKNLREEHFHMFWPQWSQVAFSCICFLDLLMAITSPDMQEATTWFQDLHNARKEMRLKSNMLPVLRLGLLRIDAIFWKGIDKVLRLQPHVKNALEATLAPNKGR